jgi:cytosine/adenosine deaminase-related metal-dependent hydrolase
VRPADLIVAGGPVLTMDPARRLIPSGAVAMAGGRILAVGPEAEVTAQFEAPRRIDAAGKLAMPGLIDVHAHAGHALIRGAGRADGDAWEALCGEVYTRASPPAFWHAEARLAALERLRFGTTTGVSLLGGGDTVMRSDAPEHAAAHCEGALGVGIRDVIAIGPTRPPHPRTYAEWEGDARRDRPVSYEEQRATTEAVLRDWHGARDGRLRVALLTPVLRDAHERDMAPADYAAARAQSAEIRAMAREAGTVFTQDGHWRGSVRRAAGMGILGPGTLLSHCIDIDADEQAMLADTGSAVAHNPSAVASILGRCPATELMAMGVAVGLGSDATAPDRSADMFRHVQQAMHYHRTHFRDPSVLPAGQALAMATIEAARALGLESEIGSLEEGKRADIVLLDLARAHMAPFHMPLHRAACFANGNDVHTVIVGGEVVLEDRRATRVDEAALLAAAHREAELMLDRTGARPLLDEDGPRTWGQRP